MVPGFVRPSLALRSEKELMTSPRALAKELAKRALFSESIVDEAIVLDVVATAPVSSTVGLGVDRKKAQQWVIRRHLQPLAKDERSIASQVKFLCRLGPFKALSGVRVS